MDIQTFLFGPYPLQLQTVDKIFFFDAAGALLLAIILMALPYLKKLNSVNLSLVQRIRNLGFFYGIYGLLWSAFRYEGAVYLEWRLWIVIGALAAVVWLVKILIYLLHGYRHDLSEFKNQEVKQKYLKS